MTGIVIACNCSEADYTVNHLLEKMISCRVSLQAVDYEDVKDLNLGIGVVNNAPFHPSVSGGGQGMNVNFGGSGGGAGGSGGGGGGGAGGGGAGGGGGGAGGGGGSSSGGSWSASGAQVYNVNIKVKNQPEGPKFMPLTKAIPISEGKTFNSNEVIARYPAIDTDTGKEATNVKYVYIEIVLSTIKRKRH